MMEVVDFGGTGTSYCSTQCRDLCSLETVNKGVCCARFPGGRRIEWSDGLFVHLSDVFFWIDQNMYL